MAFWCLSFSSTIDNVCVFACGSDFILINGAMGTCSLPSGPAMSTLPESSASLTLPVFGAGGGSVIVNVTSEGIERGSWPILERLLDVVERDLDVVCRGAKAGTRNEGSEICTTLAFVAVADVCRMQFLAAAMLAMCIHRRMNVTQLMKLSRKL